MIEVTMFAVTAQSLEKARFHLVTEVPNVGSTLSGPEGSFHSAFVYINNPTDEDYRVLHSALNDFLTRSVILAVGVYSKTEGNITAKILNYTEDNE